MPSAHFKDFKGIAPRVRGATQFAQVASNVDLYGNTIRPFPRDLVISEPKTAGKFVRIEGNLHHFPNADELKLMTFKGYYVVLYRNVGASKWEKKVFETSDGKQPVITPVSFNPPSFPVGSVRRPKVSEIPLKYSTTLSRHIYKAGESPLPPDTYQYFIEVVNIKDGKEHVVVRSEKASILVEYKYYKDPTNQAYNEQLEVDKNELSSPKYIKATASTNEMCMLFGYTGWTGAVDNRWGYLDNGDPMVKHSNIFRSKSIINQILNPIGNAVNDLTGIPAAIFDPLGDFARNGFSVKKDVPTYIVTNPLDSSTIKYIDKWWYPYTTYQGIDYGNISTNCKNSILANNGVIGNRTGLRMKGVVTALGKPTMLDTYNPLEDVLDDSLGNINTDWNTYDNNKVTKISGYFLDEGGAVESGPYSLKDVYFFDTPSPADEVRSYRLDFSVNKIDTTGLEGDFKYRLYRSSSFDNGFYKVCEVDNSSLPGYSQLILSDTNTPETTNKAGDEFTFTYFTTFERTAGKSANGIIEDWREESGPSELQEIVNYTPNQYITRPPISGDVMGADTWNIYRLHEYADGTNEYQLVTYLDISVEEYYDTKADIDLGPTSESTFLSDAVPYSYEAMPDGLTNLSALYNGMMFGWKGGQLYWTDQFYLSGWSPSTFSVEIPYNIVNIIPLGNVMAIVTTHGVYRALASSPFDFSFVESPSGEGGRFGLPDTVIGSDKGVLFVSDSGINIYDGVRATSMTDGYIGEEFLRTDLDLSNGILRENDGLLHLFHASGVLIIDGRSQQITTISDVVASYVFRDHEEGALFYTDPQNRIKQLFAKTESKRSLTYRTGEVHFGKPGRKRAKFIQFLGTGTIQCTPYVNGATTGLKAKLINMEAMERDARIYLPDRVTLDSLELEITGTGEVKEFLIDWELM
jgi:hypothetical protein